MNKSRRNFIKSIAIAGAGLSVPLAIAGKRKQNIFTVPEDCGRVHRVLLDGKEVKHCIYANTDLGRADGKGFVKYYPDPFVLDENNCIRVDCAKGHVEVELYIQLEIEGLV